MTSFLIQIDVIELVLNVAAGKKGGAEVPPGSNAGPFVTRVLARTGNKPGDAWCAANVADTGVIALQHTPLVWPLPLTASCYELGEFARAKNILYTRPQRGDVWLRYSEEHKRFAHTGFVLSMPDAERIEVQAGNTIRPGQTGDTREGWLDWTRVERIGERDGFARWVELLKAPSALLT